MHSACPAALLHASGCEEPWAGPRLGAADLLLRERLMFPGGLSADLSSSPLLASLSWKPSSTSADDP